MKWIKKDSWFTIDKLHHITACFMMTTIIGWGFASAVGILKEIFDIIRGNGASWKDLIADCIGIGLALLVKAITIL